MYHISSKLNNIECHPHQVPVITFSRGFNGHKIWVNGSSPTDTVLWTHRQQLWNYQYYTIMPKKHRYSL